MHEQGASADRTPLRVLLVEDDDDLRKMLRAALVRAGYSIGLECDRGDDPALTADVDVDVAVVDLTLPGLSGVEVIRGLLDRRPSLPVLVLSSSSHGSAVTEALLAGALGYVVKGARLQDLTDAVQMVARRQPALSAEAQAALSSRTSSADVERALARVRRWL
jgi:two-component system response regulator PhoP